MSSTPAPRRERVSSDLASKALIEAVIGHVDAGSLSEMTARRLGEETGLDPKAIFRNFGDLQGLYIAALRELEHQLVEEEPTDALAPGQAVSRFFRYHSWLVVTGIAHEKLAAEEDFVAKFRLKADERIGYSPALGPRASQAIFTLASALIQAQVEFLPSQPNVFPPESLNDVAELLQAVIDRMPVFSQELGWNE
jgi:hypothetical protein